VGLGVLAEEFVVCLFSLLLFGHVLNFLKRV
jgi:hypothetical protein